eukprot:symbB.v1.2.014684.t1/scaffold1073.1/size139849/5
MLPRQIFQCQGLPGFCCRRITVGAPERLKGLYRAATAPQQAISLQDKVDYCLSNLEQISAERMDPLKLRYQRRLKELHQARGVLTSSQMLRLMDSLSEHPLALYSEAARPLMDVSSQRLAVAKLENPPPSHLAGASLCLALYARRSQEPQDGPEVQALNRLLAKVVETEATLPPSLSSAEFLAKPLLAAALLTPLVAQDLSAAISKVLEEESFWRRHGYHGSRDVFGGFQSKQLATVVGALGLLQERNALPAHASQRVRRLLDLDRFDLTVELPQLVLLCQGLEGLGLEGLLIQARSLQQNRLAQRGAAAVPVLELCEALQLLKSCGRLTPKEPFVFDLVRLAANHVDRLKRGERKLLRSLLEDLAQQLGFEPGVSWIDLAQAPVGHDPGSPEAALCLLARYDWFSRKSRSHTSWPSGSASSSRSQRLKNSFDLLDTHYAAGEFPSAGRDAVNCGQAAELRNCHAKVDFEVSVSKTCTM